MPQVQARSFFPLEIIHDGWVLVLEDWARWKNDPSGHAHDNAAAWAGAFLYLEGLDSPSRPITAQEATCLRSIMNYFDTYRAASPRMRKKLITSNQQIVSDMGDANYKPGWEYLRDAFGIDVRPPTLSGLANPQSTPLDNVQTMQDIGNVIHNGGYDVVVLSPGDRTVSEYETAESALQQSSSSSSPSDPASGADPQPVDPNDPDPGEGI